MTPSDLNPVQRPDRLALLYRLSQTFNSSLDLDQVLNLVMDEVISATQAERGFLMLGEPAGELEFRAARGLDQLTIDHPQSQVSTSVIQRVAQEGKPLLTSNAQDENWLSDRRSVIFLGLRSVLCVPLQVKGVTQGVIYVDNRIQSGIFTQDDLELLTAISSSAAIAIENARLFRVAVEKGRMERELQLARGVQTSLLPKENPEIPGWEISVQWRPAREAAGDFYDFHSSTSDQLGVIIADVSDKGMAAALYMALTRSILRSCMASAQTIAEGISQANKLICADTTYGMFVTLFYAQINSKTSEVHYVNAGHNPPLLYRLNEQEPVQLTRTGMALGIEETTQYEQHTVQLEPGDLLFLYTDGVTDALNEHEQEFDIDQLNMILHQHRNKSAQDTSAAVVKSVLEHMGAAPQFDDITLVAIKRLGAA